MFSLSRLLPFLLAVADSPATTPPAALVSRGSEWRYFDQGTAPAATWREPGFDDSAWKSGRAKLGFSDGAVTAVRAGADPKNRPISYYFRRDFQVAAPAGLRDLHLELLRDDGAVVYLNGKEVARNNLPGGKIGPLTLAKAAVAAPNETRYFPIKLNPADLVAGRNVVAVEVHQNSPASSDLGFDLELWSSTEPQGIPGGAAPVAALRRGPYLQQAGPTTITVRWRTAAAETGVVKFGAAPTALTGSLAEAAPATDHEVTLTGLQPRTTYYYSIGSATATLAGGDAGTCFTTPPPAGTPQPTRVWVLGDAGTKTLRQARVRNAFYQYASATRLPDLCLLLGDNSYDRGLDEEYQQGIFEMYPAMLRRVPFWSCLGNHDTAQSVSYVNTYPYFRIFTFPTKGECGGIPSGTEHFYSFDFGNIHFVSLDSMTANRRPDGPMGSWVVKDLAATTATWIVVLFHHPPYTKGSHDSDKEKELMEMRRNFLPLLEQGGVDLVLNGHSHAYERSFLLDGHHGLSGTFGTPMKKQPGSGDPNGEGAYLKPLTGPRAKQGTVYNVTGSAGQTSGGTLNHPAMCRSMNVLGSVVLDIAGPELTSTFLDADGVVRDTYRIIKRDR